MEGGRKGDEGEGGKGREIGGGKGEGRFVVIEACEVLGGGDYTATFGSWWSVLRLHVGAR